MAWCCAIARTRRVDGLPPGEGVFLACSFWLADNLILQGRKREARALFERLLGLCNDVGLLAEEYDPRARRQLGNFPQAFSHLALINTALNLHNHGPAHRRRNALTADTAVFTRATSYCHEPRAIPVACGWGLNARTGQGDTPLRRADRGGRCHACGSGRPDGRHHRPVGRRQIDAAAHGQPADRPERGTRAVRGPRHHRAAAAARCTPGARVPR